MRIVFVAKEYPPYKTQGGIGTQTYIWARGMAALGHEVEVIGHSLDRAKHVVLDHGVRVTRIPGFEGRLDMYTEPAWLLTYSTEVAVALGGIHAQSPVDLVVFPEWGGEGYVHLANQTPYNHIPSVVHLHGPMVMYGHTMDWPDRGSEYYRLGTFMESACLRLADAVASSSQCSVDWCQRHYGFHRPVPVLISGVDTGHFCPRPVPKEERLTIIFVGGIRPNKGVQMLLEACLRLAPSFPSLQLRLLGGGEESLIRELKTTAAQKGPQGLLDMPGLISHQELPLHLCRAHAFAGPSVYEGGPGMVYLEAMACGLPVVACSGSGVSESVVDGETGFLIPPQDTDALVDKLKVLLSDPVRRQTMGQQARQRVLREADSKACLKKLESFYADTVKNAPSVEGRIKQ